MRLVVFGLTVSSSWGNGHATLWRGLWRALARRGHEVVFFERDVPYYADHRDLTRAARRRAGAVPRLGRHPVPRARASSRDADAVMVTSYCPDGIAATRLLVDSGTAAVKLFYDLDTPVTLEALRDGRPRAVHRPARAARLRPGAELHRRRRARRPADAARRAARRHAVRPCRPAGPPPGRGRGRATAAACRTWARTQPTGRPRWKRCSSSRRGACPAQVFLIGGAQYPADFPWTANIRFVRHLPPAEHPAFFSSSRLTLNVTRRAMAENGPLPLRPAVRGGRLRHAGR